MSLLNSIQESYHRVMSKGDPQMDQFLLMRSPIPTVVLCLSYVYFVKYLGPRLMANRRPMELTRLMIAYNILTVIWNATFVFAGTSYYLIYGASLKCDSLDQHSSFIVNFNRRFAYYYYILKLMEFSDTIFAVLRKKSNQVSNLHVLHHGILPFSVWIGIRFIPGAHGNFFGWLNSIVHVVMYSYYALAALGPDMQKHLWWKKYLTQLQLTHFLGIALHQSQVFFNGCGYPKLLSTWIILHAIMFFILFSDFYKTTYSSQSKLGKAHVNGEEKVTRNGLKAD